MRKVTSIVLFFCVLVAVLVLVGMGSGYYFSPEAFLELLDQIEDPLDFNTYVMGSVADDVPAESIVTTYAGPGGGENGGGFAGGSFVGETSDITANPFTYIGYWFSSAFSFSGFTEFWDGLRFGFTGIGIFLYRLGNYIVSQLTFFANVVGLIVNFDYIKPVSDVARSSGSYVPVLF